MTPEYKAEQIASQYRFLEGESKTDEAMQARIIDGALQMYQWAKTQFMRNNNMQSLKTKSKKSMSERISDATEKLCVIFLVLFIWSCAFFLVAVGIYALFNLL